MTTNPEAAEIIRKYLEISCKDVENHNALHVRDDIPDHLRDELFLHVLRLYREQIGEEPPTLRLINKPTSIGLIELSLRTRTKIDAPLAVRVAPKKTWNQHRGKTGPY